MKNLKSPTLRHRTCRSVFLNLSIQMTAAAATVTLELPRVAYPRKVYFPEGAHSILILYGPTQTSWTLVEDKQVPHLDDALLSRSVGYPVRSAIYAPAYFGITPRQCYEFIRIQLHLASLTSSPVTAAFYKNLTKAAILRAQMDAIRIEMGTLIDKILP
jgi:hypothetical protein